MRNAKREYIDALVKSSERDPILFKRKGVWSHDDGWGFFDLGRLIHYRSPKPIFQDNLELLMMSKGPLLIHSRKASMNKDKFENLQPVNVLNTLWVTYNGDVDPYAFKPEGHVKKLIEAGRYADTMAVAWKAYTLYVDYGMKEAVKLLYEFLQNSLPENKGASILLLSSEGELGFAWHCNKCEEKNEKYYMLVKGEDWVGSSTLSYHLKSEKAPNYGLL